MIVNGIGASYPAAGYETRKAGKMSHPKQRDLWR